MDELDESDKKHHQTSEWLIEGTGEEARENEWIDVDGNKEWLYDRSED